MWKCKHCGGRKFEIERIIIDSKKNTININGIKRSVMCCNCSNCGEDIQAIADWEEEDERD